MSAYGQQDPVSPAMHSQSEQVPHGFIPSAGARDEWSSLDAESTASTDSNTVSVTESNLSVAGSESSDRDDVDSEYGNSPNLMLWAQEQSTIS